MSDQVELEIEYELSESEATEKAKEGVRLSAELDKLEEAFKDARADWRRRIKDMKAARDAANMAFMLGTEPRKIHCVEVVNLDKRQFEYVHNGRIIRTRDMTPDDLAKHGTAPMFPASDDERQEIRDIISGEKNRKKKKDHTV
jgi:hypothetical protein